MNRIFLREVLALGVVFGLGWAKVAVADDSATTAKEATFKGVVASVDHQNKMVWVHHIWGTKRFNIADDCSIAFQDKPTASVADLRQGQELQVSYQKAQGVLVAHHIQQYDLKFTGRVLAFDSAEHSLILRHHALDKPFRIPADCVVMLHGGKEGTLADVQPGHLATVTFEVPEGHATAREIAQTSETFTGELTAVDLEHRTVRAKGLSSEKTFTLAGDCSIVLANKPGAKLRDLKLGDKLAFSYDDVSGVDIVNRIGTPGPPAISAHTSASAARMIPPE
jgi:Cu/Ag efflux protein CusF